jgi:hypothetical protein
MKLFYIKKKPLFLKKKFLKLYKHKFYVMYKIYEYHNDLIFQKKTKPKYFKAAERLAPRGFHYTKVYRLISSHKDLKIYIYLCHFSC